jgi:hypothetical protein
MASAIVCALDDSTCDVPRTALTLLSAPKSEVSVGTDRLQLLGHRSAGFNESRLFVAATARGVLDAAQRVFEVLNNPHDPGNVEIRTNAILRIGFHRDELRVATHGITFGVALDFRILAPHLELEVVGPGVVLTSNLLL